MEEKKKPAFPTQKGKHYGFGTDDPGMTLRDYFAAKAMQGWIANPKFINNSEEVDYGVKQAYKIADAMLNQRKKE